MAYAKPSVWMIGGVTSVVLGSGTEDPDDTGSEMPQPGKKNSDIAAGLDD